MIFVSAVDTLGSSALDHFICGVNVSREITRIPKIILFNFLSLVSDFLTYLNLQPAKRCVHCQLWTLPTNVGLGRTRRIDVSH